MTDDNLEPMPRRSKKYNDQYKAMVDKVNNSTDADIAECGQVDFPSQLHKDIWNRAIDKCLEHLNGYYKADVIRSLKV